MAIIYFGGTTRAGKSKRSYPVSYTKDMDLDALSSEGFRVAFEEWVVQCWLHDNDVPNDLESLKDFDLAALHPLFREKFASGDWEKLRAGKGATAEEYLLFLQLKLRIPLALVLNKDQPKQDLGRVKSLLKLSTYEIGSCLISFLVNVSKELSPSELGLPVMLYDGHIGHVISIFVIDDTRNWISYEDPTWPKGKSMLCAGENHARIDATYLGETEIGHWAVSAILLPEVIYAIPLPLNQVKIWRRWSREAGDALQKYQEYR